MWEDFRTAEEAMDHGLSFAMEYLEDLAARAGNSGRDSWLWLRKSLFPPPKSLTWEPYIETE